MAHSFFKFGFGRDGMPGNMEQSNWQRLAKYMKNAREYDDIYYVQNELKSKIESYTALIRDALDGDWLNSLSDEDIDNAISLRDQARNAEAMDDSDEEFKMLVENLDVALGELEEAMTDSNLSHHKDKQARVAHRVWDIVSNDGVPTAHRKVDEMTVINRDHKRLAEQPTEFEPGDLVLVFTDGMRMQARVASVQSDGALCLDVDGSLVDDVDPAFVLPA